MSTQVVSVALPSEIVYVSGTVNFQEYTWTLADGAWQATVERAADEKYAVALTAVTAAGNSSSFEFTLYYGLLNLITDRTLEDVRRVSELFAKGWSTLSDDERSEWMAGMKGAYNATDLNRVGGATTYLANLLVQLPEEMLNYLGSLDVADDEFFTVPYPPEDYNFTGETGWTVGNIPTEAQMAQYLAKVRLLRAAFEYETDALPESMVNLDYLGANAIEKALLRLFDTKNTWEADKKQWADKTALAWYYSGDLYSAEI